MVIESHLILQELMLRPSEEWTPHGRGWVMARVAEGVGYWMQGGNARELNVGDCFVVSFNDHARLLVSQLSSLKLQFFTVQPECLKGFLTVIEWHHLEYAPDQSATRTFVFGANELIGQKFSRLATQPCRASLVMRCAWLQLWASAVAGLAGEPASNVKGSKLRDRFVRLLGEIPEIELSEHSLSELAAQLNCSRRHLARVFHREFGVQFDMRCKEIRPMPSRPNFKGTNAVNQRPTDTNSIAQPQGFDGETGVKNKPAAGAVAGKQLNST